MELTDGITLKLTQAHIEKACGDLAETMVPGYEVEKVNVRFGQKRAEVELVKKETE